MMASAADNINVQVHIFETAQKLGRLLFVAEQRDKRFRVLAQIHHAFCNWPPQRKIPNMESNIMNHNAANTAGDTSLTVKRLDLPSRAKANFGWTRSGELVNKLYYTVENLNSVIVRMYRLDNDEYTKLTSASSSESKKLIESKANLLKVYGKSGG